MLATKMHRIAMSPTARSGLTKVAPNLLRKSSYAPAVQQAILSQPCKGFASGSSQEDNRNKQIIRDHVQKFSTVAVAGEPGVVEQKLQALDMSTVRKIKAELMEVDANSDGRLDAEELKQLLKKHSDQFSDEQVIEIGELFYAAKAGEPVTFESFIHAIDRVAAASVQSEEGPEEKTMAQHFKESGGHPLGIGNCPVEFMHLTKSHHGHYTPEELDVNLTHTPPSDFSDKLAFNCVKLMRKWFDLFTGWNNDNITVNNILNRTIYLETIAAVPGMVAAIVRHFRSLRNMKSDGGYMQLFLEEANNERMHLLTFVRMKDPHIFLRAAVIVGQFGFGAAFLTAYAISPRFCHRFVGYVEEEACSTYTKIIKAIETAPEGTELATWRTQAPPRIAQAYWKLHGKTVLDLIYAVRADEAEHRDVNHLISGVKEGQINPLYNPESKLDTMLSKYVADLMKPGKD